MIHYSWASPDRDSVTSRQITKNQAVPLLALLSTTENLAVEPIEITGRLRKVDADSRAWRITDDRGQEFSGKTREGVSLEKLVIGSFYIFECEEEVEEVTGTGREIWTGSLGPPQTSQKLGRKRLSDWRLVHQPLALDL